MNYIKIFVLFCFVLIVNKCSGQEKSNSFNTIEYENYSDGRFLVVTEYMCDYYYHKNEYPYTKKDFEDFIKQYKNNGSELLQIINNFKYGFKYDSIKNNIVFYDFGPDKEDDKLEKELVHKDSLHSNIIGDIPIIALNIEKCNKKLRKRKLISTFINKDGHIVFNESKLIKKELKDVISMYVQSNRKEHFFVPKMEEEPRLSVFEATFENGWNIEIISNEHDKVDLENMMEKINNYLTNSFLIKEYEIVKIIHPILYFENNQVIYDSE